MTTSIIDILQGQSSSLDLDIEESQKECTNDEDICFGFLTMINANFTKSYITTTGVGAKLEPVFEIRVEKGCGKKSEFMTNVKEGNYHEISNQQLERLYESQHQMK